MDFSRLSDPAAAGIGFAALTLVAALFAGMLRWGRAPGGASGAAVLGGVFAGLLLGAGVLGRAAPGVFDDVYIGANSERAALSDAVSMRDAHAAALREAGADDGALRRALAEHESEIAALLEAEAGAMAQRRGALLAWGVGSFLLMLVALSVLRMHSPPRRALPAAARGSVRMLGAGTGAVAGLVAAAGLLAFSVASVPGALGWGFAVTIGSVAPGVRARKVGRWGRDGMTDLATACAFGMHFVMVCVFAGLALLSVLALPAVVGLGLGRTRRASRRVRRGLRLFALGVLAPGVVAFCVSRVDPFEVWTLAVFWVGAVVAAVVATDGRWINSWALWRFSRLSDDPREPALRASAQVASGVGATQCGAALLLYGAGAIGAPLLAGAVVGALAVEMVGQLYKPAVGMLFKNGARNG
ncbi:MAG: hypothetical protein EA379_12150 [Phycisphaerales bacterium]|nr:MAG: hypothetical protein EA379_12150 [Phycisphaerales bacterium]